MIPRSPYLRRIRVMDVSGFSFSPHHRFHECSWDPIDFRIRIQCACDMTGQSAMILPEFLVQPNSGDQRHCTPRVIDAYWILHVLQVPRGCWIVRSWMCFLLYRWLSRTSMWHSMSKKKGGTLNVIVRTWRWMVLVGLHGSNCLHPLLICALYVLCMVLCTIRIVYPSLMDKR